MKILRNEYGKEVIYVQMQEMGFLNSLDFPIPTSIYTQVFCSGVTMIGEHNRFDYIRFEKEDEVKYFKDLDAIIDYDQFSNLSLEELKNKSAALEEKINSIVDKYNLMSIEERKENTTLFLDYEKMKYMDEWIEVIFSAKILDEKLPMPKKSQQKKKILLKK